MFQAIMQADYDLISGEVSENAKSFISRVRMNLDVKMIKTVSD
jgi:hypothetical protein